MKYLYLLCYLLSCSGCSLVSCNHAFPKAEWYWSADAKQCRQEMATEKEAGKQFDKIKSIKDIN